MDIEQFFLDNCPVEIVAEVKAADLIRPIGEDIFFTVENSNAGPVCALASTLYLAPKISRRSSLEVQIGFLSSAATYAGLFPVDSLPAIADAILKIQRTNENTFIYFKALRLNKIDVRTVLFGSVVPNWAFQHPRDMDAATWHYNLYLASLGEDDALNALIDKVQTTMDATAVYALLVDLAELPAKEVTQLLRSYLDDTRSTRGSNGPGATLGELVPVLVDRRI